MQQGDANNVRVLPAPLLLNEKKSGLQLVVGTMSENASLKHFTQTLFITLNNVH
jgi:hypothetical protein